MWKRRSLEMRSWDPSVVAEWEEEEEEEKMAEDRLYVGEGAGGDRWASAGCGGGPGRGMGGRGDGMGGPGCGGKGGDRGGA